MKQHLAPRTARRIAQAKALSSFSVSITGGAIKGQWSDRDTLILHVNRDDDPEGIAARAAIMAAWCEVYPNKSGRCPKWLEDALNFNCQRAPRPPRNADGVRVYPTGANEIYHCASYIGFFKDKERAPQEAA